MTMQYDNHDGVSCTCLGISMIPAFRQYQGHDGDFLSHTQTF